MGETGNRVACRFAKGPAQAILAGAGPFCIFTFHSDVSGDSLHTKQNKEVDSRAKGPGKGMSKQLVIKPEKCVGCRTCELMCSFDHNQQFNPRLSAVSVMDFEAAAVAIPVMCMQCEEACCEKVCPVGAISRDENGAVRMNSDKCIVCKMCMYACPLGNIRFSPITRRVFKCDLCGGDPKCAKFCPSGAIQFLDPVDDLDRKKAIAESFKRVFGEVEA